jgi:hypothetical protein
MVMVTDTAFPFFPVEEEMFAAPLGCPPPWFCTPEALEVPWHLRMVKGKEISVV